MGVLVAEPEILANEGWFNNRWRPAMAWLWFVVSAFDFIIFPILNAFAAGAKWIPYSPWQPITLLGGGMFHVGMSAVVGVATWRRTDEKMAAYAAEAPSSVTIEKTTEKTSSVTAQQSPVTATEPDKSASSRKD